MLVHLRQHVAVEERRQDPALLARRPVELAVLVMDRRIAVVSIGTLIVEDFGGLMDGGMINHSNCWMDHDRLCFGVF